MYNKVTLVGRLTRDPESRTTSSGKQVANITLAVDRGFKDKDSNESKADFIRVNIWEKQAELAMKYLTKGQLILIEGSLRTGSYEKEGQKYYTTDITSSKIIFLGKSKRADDELGVNDVVEDVFFPTVEDDVPF
jgi:single-strand DNA-binding protein